jgi:glyoxylase-like metal-dependent hydrolase (beta-lactamase superfamily II)
MRRIVVKNKFFSAEELTPGTWRITNCFDSHATMTTFAYLVEGSDRAMVIDTMFGYGNLKSFCRELTDKPLVLVNTHYHGDHTGGNFDFDECYIHADDIPYMKGMMNAIADPAAYRREMLDRMQRAALPEYRDMVTMEDASLPHGMPLWPLWDGDVFDLGGRNVEVIHVGGHTPGEIVLLDRAARICFTGDACNSNTLLQLPGSLSVEEYLEFLYHFKTFQDSFTICYGGHEDFDSSIIDEGIALCRRVIAGSDDREEREFFGRPTYYGAKHKEEGKGRADGGSFNIAYSKDHVKKTEKENRVL